ncbi:MAG: hypothetical protein EAZ53_01235 [Bacteroidetes bacterium]|nr:MAG: hypothetical protein EAZ53_01235 [Bacteroidota bacterium]
MKKIALTFIIVFLTNLAYSYTFEKDTLGLEKMLNSYHVPIEEHEEIVQEILQSPNPNLAREKALNYCLYQVLGMSIPVKNEIMKATNDDFNKSFSDAKIGLVFKPSATTKIQKSIDKGIENGLRKPEYETPLHILIDIPLNVVSETDKGTMTFNIGDAKIKNSGFESTKLTLKDWSDAQALLDKGLNKTTTYSSIENTTIAVQQTYKDVIEFLKSKLESIKCTKTTCDACPSGWEYLISFDPSTTCQGEINRRIALSTYSPNPYKNWSFLKLCQAKGSKINLDYYPLNIKKLPTINNISVSKNALLNYVRTHLGDFLDESISSFVSYSSEDKSKWVTTDPTGTVMVFKINIVEDATVIASRFSSDSWIFSTIQSPDDFQHPVSGNRMFAIELNNNGEYVFYTKGADRLTGILDNAISNVNQIAFENADKLWRSLLVKLNDFINRNGGISNIKENEIIWQQKNW